MKNTYNGWANYETWLVKLWMDNNQGDYEHFRELAKNYHGMVTDFANAIEDFHLDMKEESKLGNGVLSDLLTAALQKVDWYEIAESILEDN